MKSVKVAVIGCGGMGTSHARAIKTLDHMELVALCDADAKNVGAKAEELGCEAYTDYNKLIKSGVCEAVVIATPHYSHTTIGIAALKAGLHVLVEKPISVHKADAEKLIGAYDPKKKQVFAAMFNQRTDACFKKLKWLVDSGELGEIFRVNWIITNWFRTQAYYNSGTWRATWEGEGGGVLLNQCPHQLDLFQWICGMPTSIRAFCHLSKYHKIEVEDDVTAYMEYPNGATGVFIASTGEAPGTNRLEISADRGKVVVEDGKIKFYRNEESIAKFCKTTKEPWGSVAHWDVDVPLGAAGGAHKEIIENFGNAILKDEALIAPAEEGIKSVELANAMLYSSLTGKTVDLPLDSKAYERKLKQLIRESKKCKKK